MPGMNINAGAHGNPLDELLARNGGNLWGSSNGMLYQYGRDSTGRDTFGPGTAEDGTPLGNQDHSMIGSQDPRHGAASEALARLGHGWTQIRNTNIGGPGGVRDPSQVRYDPTVGLVTQEQNLNPMADDTGRNMAIVLAPALAGMALGGMSGAGLGASYGDSIGALAGGGTSAGASAGGLPDSYWSMGADSGQLGTDAAVDGAAGSAGDYGGYVGGLDPETASGQVGGMGVAQNGIGPGAFGDQVAGAINNPSSLISRAGSAIGNNPMQAARLGMGLYALGSANSSGSNSGNSSGGSGNMSDPASIINAMAQANRVNQTSPFGSRTWSQDPNTGQWSVADAMNPTEQANYENVAGMNTDVTNYARQRLAALMSAPPAQRADRPISFRLHGG